MYAKSFMCELTIYPEFHKDPYSGYVREEFSKWISNCFKAYTASFRLQAYNNGSKIYLYNSETDSRDINTKKIWQELTTPYSISIGGEGLIMNSSSQLYPPVSVTEAVIDKIQFKYKECSDISSPCLITYGRETGLPERYSRDSTMCEEWKDGTSQNDMYCPKWTIDISCGTRNFDAIRLSIRNIISLNQGDVPEMEIDPYGLNIRVSGAYHLISKDKTKYTEYLDKLCCLLLDDDNVEVNDFSMDFISSDSTFMLESYIFDENKCVVTAKKIFI